MKLLTVASLIGTVALLGAASAHSQSHSRTGTVTLDMRGWGYVKLDTGVAWHGSASCMSTACPATTYLRIGQRVVVTERAYLGWKFTGWHGACKNTKPKCVIDPGWLQA